MLSGGLGPTEDDLTREATAEALGVPLEHHEDLLEEIRERFAARGFTMGDSNRKQALLPQGATAIPISGTAPGFFLEHEGTLVVALPGVPWELKEMWEGTIEPRLAARPGSGDGHAVRRIRVFGIGESMAAEKLADLPWRGSDVEIGTRASLEELTIILRGPATPGGHAAPGRARGQGARGARRPGVRRGRPGTARDRRRAAAGARPHRRGGRVVHRRPGGQALHRRARQQRLLPGRRHRVQQRGQDERAGRAGGDAGRSTGR